MVTGKKEKLSELEQQSKKAEAAQRRRMQSEKAAREAEVCLPYYILDLSSLDGNLGSVLIFDCCKFRLRQSERYLGKILEGRKGKRK